MIKIRILQERDLARGFFETLEELSPVGEISQDKKRRIWRTIRDGPYFIFVADNGKEIIGSTTLFVEQKVIHKGGKVGHIEDVVVRKSYRGKKLGQKLVQTAVRKAKMLGCYKAILDCSEHNVAFYESVGFRRHEIEMRIDLNPHA